MIEKNKLIKIDELDCAGVDFLLFFDYMFNDSAFKPYVSYSFKTFVNEINMAIVLKKLNLFTTPDQLQIGLFNGLKQINYDYETIIKTALKNKCASNLKKYAIVPSQTLPTNFNPILDGINSPSNIMAGIRSLDEYQLSQNQVNSPSTSSINGLNTVNPNLSITTLYPPQNR